MCTHITAVSNPLTSPLLSLPSLPPTPPFKPLFTQERASQMKSVLTAHYTTSHKQKRFNCHLSQVPLASTSPPLLCLTPRQVPLMLATNTQDLQKRFGEELTDKTERGAITGSLGIMRGWKRAADRSLLALPGPIRPGCFLTASQAVRHISILSLL